MSHYEAKPRVSYCPVVKTWIVNATGARHICSTDTNPNEIAFRYRRSAIEEGNDIGRERLRAALAVASRS